MAAAWRRGWQPADVARLVRRELEDAHLGLAAALIRAQAAGRPAPRPPLDRPARRPRRPAGRPAPPTASRTPPPSWSCTGCCCACPRWSRWRSPAAAAGTAAPPASSAVSARCSPRPRRPGIPEEAEALTAKAQELMARHSVDEALLAAAAPAPDAPGACRIGVEPPYEQAKAVLLDAVARPTTAARCGTNRSASPRSSASRPTWRRSSCCTPRCWCRPRTRWPRRRRRSGPGAASGPRPSGSRSSRPTPTASATGSRPAAESQVSQDLLPVLATREDGGHRPRGQHVPARRPPPGCAASATRPGGRRARRRRTGPRSGTAAAAADR